MKGDKRQILILGGTGPLGTNLVDILNSQDNSHIVVTSRKSHDNYGNVEYRCGDAHDTEWLKSILEERNWDAIVDFMLYTTEEFVERLNLLLESTRQYVFTSSARVYANSNGERINEESPRLLDITNDKKFLQTDSYAITKARQEDALMQRPLKNWTIIRPYLTFSDNRLQLGVMEKEHWLIPALNNRPIVFSRDIAAHYTTMTDGAVVAKCIAALIGKQESYGEVFLIASNVSYKWDDILKWYLDCIFEERGEKPTVFYTEQWDSTYGGEVYEWKYDRLYDRFFF